MKLPLALESIKPSIVSADGTMIWAAHAGRSSSEAPTLLLVPGFSCSSVVFVEQFQDPQLLGKFSLITYEPRGQGRSGHPVEKEAYSSQRYAEDFRAVCDAFGAKTVYIAGWSYGGLVPCDIYAHLGPQWISGIIYLGAVPWREMHPEAGNPAVFELVEPIMSDDVEKSTSAIPAFIKSCFYMPNQATVPYSLLATMVAAIAVQRPTARRLSLFERHQDPSKLLEQSQTVEVLLVVGEHDGHLFWEKADAFMRKTYARYELKLIQEAGHAAFWEKPSEVNKAIIEFIERTIS